MGLLTELHNLQSISTFLYKGTCLSYKNNNWQITTKFLYEINVLITTNTTQTSTSQTYYADLKLQNKKLWTAAHLLIKQCQHTVLLEVCNIKGKYQTESCCICSLIQTNDWNTITLNFSHDITLMQNIACGFKMVCFKLFCHVWLLFTPIFTLITKIYISRTFSGSCSVPTQGQVLLHMELHCAWAHPRGKRGVHWAAASPPNRNLRIQIL